jgi:glycosyltransferase involved in cell wall biosynthesis
MKFGAAFVGGIKTLGMNITIPALALTAHGGGRVLVQIANHLVGRGFNVSVITSGYPGKMPFIFDKRINVIRIGPSSNSKIICSFFFLLLAPFYLGNSLIIANYFLTVIPSWIADRFFKARYVYLVQDIEYRFFHKKIYWPLRAICRWTYRRGNIISANSYLTSELRKYDVQLTLSLGVSCAFFNKANISKGKMYDIVYFLRGQCHKRIDRFDELLSVFAKKNISVLCISQDIELLESYSSKVKTLSPINEEQLIDAIDNSRILLLTSEHEGFALPPLEAMARGVPSVMFECGGPSTYAIHGENCFIVTDGQCNTALSFIEKLIADVFYYETMSAKAKATAKKFKLEEAVNEFSNYLKNKFV